MIIQKLKWNIKMIFWISKSGVYNNHIQIFASISKYEAFRISRFGNNLTPLSTKTQNVNNFPYLIKDLHHTTLKSNDFIPPPHQPNSPPLKTVQHLNHKASLFSVMNYDGSNSIKTAEAMHSYLKSETPTFQFISVLTLLKFL